MLSGVFSGISGFETFFVLCAFAGGLMLFIRLVMMLVGGDSDAGHTDMGGGADVGGSDLDGSHGAEHDSSDADFKALSLQGVSGFLLLFGIVGFALLRQAGLALLFALFGATVAGLGALWLMAKLFSSAMKLRSSGTVKIAEAVGLEGSVYLRVPAGGATGRVTVSIKGHLMELDAVSMDGAEIKTGSRVRVVSVTKGNVLSVEPIT